MPSIVPGFEYDIFISYRQNDNKCDQCCYCYDDDSKFCRLCRDLWKTLYQR